MGETKMAVQMKWCLSQGTGVDSAARMLSIFVM
jgi:hypothetical protein